LRLFEAVHPGCVTDNVGNHPNAFLNSSVEYIKAVEKKKKPEQEPAVVPTVPVPDVEMS